MGRLPDKLDLAATKLLAALQPFPAKRPNMKHLRLLLILIAISTSATAEAIYFLPINQTVLRGASSYVSIGIDGLGDGTAPSLSAWDVTVEYNPVLIEITSVLWESALDINGLGTIRGSALGFGSVNAFEVSLDSASDLNLYQSPAFLFVTFSFTALAPGVSPLSVTVNSLGDADGIELLLTDTFNGSVRVAEAPSPVPEPCTIVSVFSAFPLAAYKFYRRRRTRRLLVR